MVSCLSPVKLSNGQYVKFGMENGSGKGEKILKILEEVEQLEMNSNSSCSICCDFYVFMSVVIGIMIWSTV